VVKILRNQAAMQFKINIKIQQVSCGHVIQNKFESWGRRNSFLNNLHALQHKTA
jgi:hypothetical protein